MRKVVIALGSCIALMMLTGCATNKSQSVEELAVATPIQMIDTSVENITVTYATETVASTVKVMTQHIVKNGQFLKVVFQLVNVSQSKLPVEFKVQWLDRDGAPLTTTAPWLQTTVSGMEAKAAYSIGKSVDAVAASISVRFPENVQIYVATPDPVEQMKLEQQVVNEYNARLASGQIKY